MSNSKSLLERYSIPIEHLDFDYVQKCENVKEIEHVLEILKSGEEGYYPQLADCTEKRLRELDPANKMFRVQHELVRNSNPKCKSVQEDVEAFVSEVKQHRSSAMPEVDLEQFLPPVRQMKEKTAPNGSSMSKKTDRIKSCDYERWNKYDPDTECLKMDLHEEKKCEDLIQRKKQQQKLIEIVPTTNDIRIEQLTDAERKSIADAHRLKGNEFFRSAEYKLAISEYTKSLKFVETAAAFNNRAAAYTKLEKYSEAISDCDQCLSIESNNVKAMLRRAEALNVCGRKNDAYRQYTRVLELDPDNSVAIKAMATIPIRLEIEDVRSTGSPTNNTKTQRKIVSKLASDVSAIKGNDDIDDELRKLIIPKKIVRSKLSRAVSNIKELCTEQKPKKLTK